ncbi:TAXI family TRAP transporter solute-binding subunit [Reyranella massiliensis]|uniref:TAXI family TRAP transporter solute-binding subunit n=1 Tax=Reyranella massiliensis TaxID=445220 RepID=UPI0003040F79|nr:TAXI family TRAP transporter solute-binding subunit [Reyranella massiliensis]
MKRRQFVAAGSAAGALGLTAGWALPAAAQAQFSIATGTTGAVYYPLGGAMANILSKKVPGWAVTAEATAGSVANMHMIRDGKAQMALTQCDTAYDAIKGLDKFKDKPVDSRTLCVVYPNLVHFVTMEGTGINKLSDIKGKRISTSAPVSGSEVMALRIIDELGLKLSDIKRERLSPAESTNAMKDGKLDGYFFNGGPPVAAITDLAATQGIKIKLIPTADLVPALNKKYGPVFAASEIKAKAYPNQDAAVPVIAIWNILVVPASMKDDQAYTIIKTLWENHGDLMATHKASTDMTPENQKTANSSVPFHPGAIKFFNEKGIKLS